GWGGSLDGARGGAVARLRRPPPPPACSTRVRDGSGFSGLAGGGAGGAGHVLVPVHLSVGVVQELAGGERAVPFDHAERQPALVRRARLERLVDSAGQDLGAGAAREHDEHELVAADAIAAVGALA